MVVTSIQAAIGPVVISVTAIAVAAGTIRVPSTIAAPSSAAFPVAISGAVVVAAVRVAVIVVRAAASSAPVRNGKEPLHVRDRETVQEPRQLDFAIDSPIDLNRQADVGRYRQVELQQGCSGPGVWMTMPIPAIVSVIVSVVVVTVITVGSAAVVVVAVMVVAPAMMVIV